MVGSLAEWSGHPIELACELVDLPRSSYYYRSHKADESQLVADLKAVAGEYVTYGTRRVRSQLRRPPYSYRINRKRVQRIMRQKELLQDKRPEFVIAILLCLWLILLLIRGENGGPV